MPIGKYSHNRLATSSVEDDDIADDQEPIEESNDYYPVTHIGNEIITAVTQVCSIVEKLYSQNYSKLRSILNTKKDQLKVDKFGINVLIRSKKFGNNRCYKLSEIISVNNDSKHDNLVFIVSKARLDSMSVDVYSCNNVKAANQIVQDCMRCFETCEGVEGFKYGSFPMMVEVIHSYSDGVTSISEVSSFNVKTATFQTSNNVKYEDQPDTSEFGDFQSVMSGYCSKEDNDLKSNLDLNKGAVARDGNFENLTASENQKMKDKSSVILDEYDLFKDRPPTNIFNPYTKISINEDLF